MCDALSCTKPKADEGKLTIQRNFYSNYCWFNCFITFKLIFFQFFPSINYYRTVRNVTRSIFFCFMIQLVLHGFKLRNPCCCSALLNHLFRLNYLNLTNPSSAKWLQITPIKIDSLSKKKQLKKIGSGIVQSICLQYFCPFTEIEGNKGHRRLKLNKNCFSYAWLEFE